VSLDLQVCEFEGDFCVEGSCDFVVVVPSVDVGIIVSRGKTCSSNRWCRHDDS
jgi:hypothetical protein